jgi:hypothetical protein
MSNLIHYRHNYINPTIIRFVHEHRNFFVTISELFKKSEDLEVKLLDLDKVHFCGVDQYDPMKYIRGSSLVDRSKLYTLEGDTGRLLTGNINALENINIIEQPGIIHEENKMIRENIEDFPTIKNEIIIENQNIPVTISNGFEKINIQENQEVKQLIKEVNPNLNQGKINLDFGKNENVQTMEIITIQKPDLIGPYSQEIHHDVIHQEVELNKEIDFDKLDESDIPYSFRKSQLKEYEFNEDKNYLIDIPRESTEFDKENQLITITEKKEIIPLSVQKNQIHNSHSVIIPEKTLNDDQIISIEDKENINLENKNYTKINYTPKSNPNPPMFHHPGDKGEKKRKGMTSKKRYIK